MPNDTEEIIELKARFEHHLEGHKEDSVKYAERQLKQDLAHEKNLEAIAELTKATQGLVDAWTTAGNVQKFIKWVSTFAIIGASLVWLYSIFSKLP